MRSRCGQALVAATAMAVACAPPDMPEVPDVVASAGAQPACTPPEAVDFAWAIEPVPQDTSFDAACQLAGAEAVDGGVALALTCDEDEGPRARTLWLWATPAPPTAGLRAGPVRLRAWWPSASEGAGGRGSEAAYLRLETSGGALRAAAAGGALAPPDGEALWLPFTIAAAAGDCLSEETACGASRRAAIDVRRAGGAPRIVYDASFSPVGDQGEAQLWVAAARRGDPACFADDGEEDAEGAYYSVGLIAAR